MNFLSIFGKRNDGFVEFHDSQKVEKNELIESSKKAELQAIEIKRIISKMHSFTACEVLTQMKAPKPPITSVRRCLSNLKREGKLCRTNERRSSLYGGKEFVHIHIGHSDGSELTELSLSEWARAFRPDVIKEYRKYIQQVRYENSNLF